MATAPGKLILTGEYAVLDGAPALVVAVNRRVVATHAPATARGSSPFMLAVADALAADHPAAARMVSEISVDSSAFYQDGQKLGLGSSAAVTVAATALALAESFEGADPVAFRAAVLRYALLAHANAQGAKGARGSGADIAAAVYGGAITFERSTPPPTRSVDQIALLGGDSTAPVHRPMAPSSHLMLSPADSISISHQHWPATVRLLPFFTGSAADTASLVSRVAAARAEHPTEVEAALVAIATASRTLCDAMRWKTAPEHQPDAGWVVGGFKLAGVAIARLARATGVELVPDCVSRVAAGLGPLGGTAKTTGAGGGDIGIAVIPATADVTQATRIIIQQGCQPLPLTVDETGVDTREPTQ